MRRDRTENQLFLGTPGDLDGAARLSSWRSRFISVGGQAGVSGTNCRLVGPSLAPELAHRCALRKMKLFQRTKYAAKNEQVRSKRIYEK